MSGYVPMKVRAILALAAWMAVTLVIPVVSQGQQTRRSYASVSTTDAYGNVRPLYTPRRDVGNFSSEAQRLQMRSEQRLGRRGYNRGGETPFSLPSDQAFYDVGRMQGPAWRSNYQDTKRAYNLYGIVGARPRRDGPPDIGTLLTRQTDILRATSFTAPVWNSLSSRGLVSAGSMEDLATLPTVASAAHQGASIEAYMSGRLRHSADRLRAEAWSHFSAGRFRRALRSFESVVMLESDDRDARVAEVICYLSIGSYRAAAVSLHHLALGRSDILANPGAYAARFSEESVMQRVRAQCRLFSQANHRVADMAALNPFLLWCLGDRDAALRDAVALAQDHPASPYAAWPALMQDAASAAEPETP